MHRKGVIVGFLAGVAAAVALMILLTAGQEVPRAMAQEVTTASAAQAAPPAQKTTETVEIRAVPEGQAPAAAAQRYQIVTWSQPAGVRDTGGLIVPSHGAYVLDTQGGEVWLVDETRRPGKIERIGKVGPE
jgi:hypothetical protein